MHRKISPLRFAAPAAAAVCALNAACVSMQADSDYYRDVDFSGYETYAWISDMPLIQSAGNSVEVSPLTVRRIRESVEREMAEKGFDLVAERESADFVVSFTVGARDMIQVNDYPVYYRRPWRWVTPYYWPRVDVYMYTEGMLAIDVFDNVQREPVWHGWAKKRVTSADRTDPAPAIDVAVAAILEDFPPE